MTDHSKSVTIANGLDEKRVVAHIKKLHAIDAKGLGIRVLAGSEVDILKDGDLDYSDEILAQLDVVVCQHDDDIPATAASIPHAISPDGQLVDLFGSTTPGE